MFLVSLTGAAISWILTLAIGLALVSWLIVHTIRNAEDPPRMVVKWVLTLPLVTLILLSLKLLGPLAPFLIVLCGVVLSFMWTPHLIPFLISPLTSAFDGGNIPPDPAPLYSIARSKQKQGRYLEAVADVRHQLERFPTDVEGHLFLAQILAEDLKDLAGAELTIQRFCAQPGHAPKNLVFALNSLADWHLKLGQDRESAQRALEKIIELLPDTEFSLGAAQRIAHLAGTDQLLAPHEQKKFAVPEGVRNLGLLQPRNQPKPAAVDPGQLAAQYVKHLEQHPLDTEAREKLAVLYVDHYHRLDLATAELEQLIVEPNQPDKLVVHWLNLLADLQIRSGAPYETVRETLQRIIDRHPDLAAAEMARHRLSLLRLELKASEKTGAVKLGAYEQNIGLKRASRPPGQQKG